MSNWIPDFECRSCGSTLGRWSHNESRECQQPSCFVCGMGEWELNDMELAGMDYEGACRIAGREWGHVSHILPRLNTPDGTMSSHVTSKRALDAINLMWGMGSVDVVKKHVDVDVTVEDINLVVEALEKIVEEEK